MLEKYNGFLKKIGGGKEIIWSGFKFLIDEYKLCKYDEKNVVCEKVIVIEIVKGNVIECEKELRYRWIRVNVKIIKKRYEDILKNVMVIEDEVFKEEDIFWKNVKIFFENLGK